MADTGLEGAVELALLALDDAEDLVPALREVRERRGHGLDHNLRGRAQERLRPAEQASVADRATHDPAEHVAAALVRRQHAVRHQECDRPAVVRDDLVAEAFGLEAFRVVAQQLAHAGMDRGEQVRVVVAGNALDDARDPLETHPGVHARGGQRRQAPVGLELELHEHEVPDLEPPRAMLGMVGHAPRALGEVGASIVVELRARAARAHVGHPPPVLLVAGGKVAPADEALRGQADLVLPDGVRHVVRRIDGCGEPIARDLELDREELPGPVDRLALEVVPEAPVAEHLEQRVVARSPPDLLEVVVLPRDPEAALVVHGPDVVTLLHPGERVLELDHARVGEQQRLVAGRHEAGAGHDGVASLGEERDEAAADLRGGQVRDDAVGRGWSGHHRNGSEREGRRPHEAASPCEVSPRGTRRPSPRTAGPAGVSERAPPRSTDCDQGSASGPVASMPAAPEQGPAGLRRTGPPPRRTPW